MQNFDVKDIPAGIPEKSKNNFESLYMKNPSSENSIEENHGYNMKNFEPIGEEEE